MRSVQYPGTFGHKVSAPGMSPDERKVDAVKQAQAPQNISELQVVWACEWFHIYLYGQEFKLYSNHKALDVIYSPRSKPPPQIERWSLRLQPYRFTIHHMPGQHNPADVLSRMPLTNQPCRKSNIVEEYIHYVAVRAVPKAFSLEQISAATKDDEVLQQVKKALNSGQWPNDKEVNTFQKLKDELSTLQGLVLPGSRIVPPECLHANILKSAHQGHQGVVRTKQIVREKVW